MRPGWAALPLLIAATACNPVQQYQQAARSLRFTLERVEPGLDLAFPLDRSQVRFLVVVAVENPSAVPFRIQGFDGELRLDAEGRTLPLGRVALARPLDLAAGGRASLEIALSFGYRDLEAAWPALQPVLAGRGSGAWELEGRMRAQAYGVPLDLPVRSRRSFGAEP
jgi:hypothetical protein